MTRPKLTISHVVYVEHMGEGWKNERRAAEAFASYLREQLEVVSFSGYEVDSVSIPVKDAGFRETIVMVGGKEASDVICDAIDRFISRAWNTWATDPELSGEY